MVKNVRQYNYNSKISKGKEYIIKKCKCKKIIQNEKLHAGAKELIVPDARGTRLSDLSELKKLDDIDLRPGSMMFASPHPAGMCRMGKDPAKSVVNSNNEVHAVKGLFVTDPSAFPTAVSVDPSETIMAFSYVAAAKLLERWSNYA